MAGSNLEDQSKAKVFISYSRKDVAFADQLEAALKARGIEALIDRSEIYAFEDWWKRIQDLISQADTFVFVISPDAVGSDVCHKEVAFAASLNKRFAPVVFRRTDDKAIPEALARLNFIFFEDASRFEVSLELLAEALKTDIGWIRKHTEFGEVARRWVTATRPAGLLLRSPVLEEAERWIGARPENAPAPTEETQAFIAASRQGATRRRNILTGSMAAGLMIALVLAGLAYWQRGIAVTERDKATRSFKLAQGTAESLVIEIAQGLRNIEGMSADVGRKVLETARTTFEQLAASAPDDMNLQRSRAAMLREFGDTYSTLGDLTAALKAVRESLAIAEHLIATDPDNPRWQRELSVSYGKVGDVLFAQGKFDDTLQAYRESLAVAERLVALDAGNAQWQSDLALSRLRIGVMLQVQDKTEEALALFRNALAIMERLAANDPDNTEWQDLLLGLYDKVGDVLMKQGKFEEALKAYADSLAVQERLSAADPNNTRQRRGVAVFRDKVGDVLLKQGKLEEALKAYREALAIHERLAASDPSNTQWQLDLSLTYGNIGDILVAQNDLDEALKAYRQWLAIAERLAATDRNNPGWQGQLMAVYENVADVLAALGKLEEALKVDRQGLAVAQRVAAANPGNATRQRELQSRIQRISNLAYRFVLAHEFGRALETADEAIALQPDDIWLQVNRSHALMLVGRVDEARALYLVHRGEKDTRRGESWQTIVLKDFAEMRNAGLAHPLMDEIEAAFTTRG
jgi:tetratricopeptide (TPR) repeat protein